MSEELKLKTTYVLGVKIDHEAHELKNTTEPIDRSLWNDVRSYVLTEEDEKIIKCATKNELEDTPENFEKLCKIYRKIIDYDNSMFDTKIKNTTIKKGNIIIDVMAWESKISRLDKNNDHTKPYFEFYRKTKAYDGAVHNMMYRYKNALGNWYETYGEYKKISKDEEDKEHEFWAKWKESGDTIYGDKVRKHFNELEEREAIKRFAVDVLEVIRGTNTEKFNYAERGLTVIKDLQDRILRYLDYEYKEREGVKLFASEIQKIIEETFEHFGCSREEFDFINHGPKLFEDIRNKINEVLK